MTEEKTYDEVMESVRETIANTDAYLEQRKQAGVRQRQRQRQQDARGLLQYAVPDFGAPIRRLGKDHEAARERVRNDPDLADEARSRKLRELSAKHRQERKQEAETVRDRVGSYLSRYRAIARVDDEPTDELRYARVEREFMARVESGRIPDLESYWDAVEKGDGDQIRVFEVYGSRHISDAGRRNEFNAEVENQRQARLTDEQKLARQRIREVEAKRDDFEMGLRHGEINDSRRSE